MPKSRIRDVEDTIGEAIRATLLTAAIPSAIKIEVGWPNPIYLGKRMAANEPLITIYPMAATPGSAYLNPQMVSAPAVETLTVSVEPSKLVAGAIEIRFGGTPTAGSTIHVFTALGQGDAFYTVGASDSPTTIAVAVATAIETQQRPAIAAISLGTVTIVSGASSVVVNVSTQSTATMEVSRTSQEVQVSIWAPDPDSRDAIRSAIIASVGTQMNRSLFLSDGTDLSIRFRSAPPYVDSLEDSLTTYVAHLYFSTEYGELVYSTSTTIGSTSLGVSLNGAAPSMQYASGGSP